MSDSDAKNGSDAGRSIDISNIRSAVKNFGEERLSSSSLGKFLSESNEDGWSDNDGGYSSEEDFSSSPRSHKAAYASPRRLNTRPSTADIDIEVAAEALAVKQGMAGLKLGPGSASSDGAAGSKSSEGDKDSEVSDLLPPVSPTTHKAPLNPSRPPPAGLGGARKTLATAYKVSESLPYKRAIIPEPSLSQQDEMLCKAVVRLLEKRNKYIYKVRTPELEMAWDPEELEKCGKSGDYLEASPFSSNPFDLELKADSNSMEFKFDRGVFRAQPSCGNGASNNSEHQADQESKHEEDWRTVGVPIEATEFFTDMQELCNFMVNAAYNSFAYRRLKLLQEKFSLYQMLNAEKEFLAMKAVSHRDFYNVRKIDNHVHHSACMNQKHLLRFIKKRVREDGNCQVIERDGKILTLKEVFDTLGLSPYDLSIDMLDMHAHNKKNTTFYRFDKFNQKFNPTGEARLREIFLKTDNFVGGRYLAMLTKEVLEDLSSTKYQMAEYRLSIYGKSRNEWSKLAAWWYKHKLVSPNVAWLVQIPRLYSVYKKSGMLNNFADFLQNIFAPLIEISQNPSKDPKLYAFLENVVGFDIVDDESIHERRVQKKMPLPEEWDFEANPAYNYYLYYIYANLYVVNSFRKLRGLSQFTFRPHAGEAGDLDHLAGAFLLANSINHGINLKKSPSLQYLYYLAQIGLAMSPLSNNCLFCGYSKNPFPDFFERGLNVALSTDDPLLIHMTKEPLVEEYSIAMQVYKLSTADLSEIARHSVLQSGFPRHLKTHWVGGSEMFENDPYQSNVPNIRIQFRRETLDEELAMIHRHGKTQTNE